MVKVCGIIESQKSSFSIFLVPKGLKSLTNLENRNVSDIMVIQKWLEIKEKWVEFGRFFLIVAVL